MMAYDLNGSDVEETMLNLLTELDKYGEKTKYRENEDKFVSLLK